MNHMQKNDKNKTKKSSIKVLSHLNKMSKPLHFILKKFSAQWNSSLSANWQTMSLCCTKHHDRYFDHKGFFYGKTLFGKLKM